MEMIESLVQAGLTESEAKVYLVLARQGQMTAGSIAKAVSFHRRTVYDVLQRLLEKGLVSKISQNNKQVFRASAPQCLKDYFEEKINIVNEIIPKLTKTVQEQEQEQVRFYKGKYGLKTVFEDQISEAKPILIFSASPQAYELFKFYFKWWDLRRKEKKISVKAIFSTNMRNKLKKIPLAQIKFIPERYMGPTSINIYGNKVSQIMWNKDESSAILISNKQMSDNYRKFFDLLWKRAKD